MSFPSHLTSPPPTPHPVPGIVIVSSSPISLVLTSQQVHQGYHCQQEAPVHYSSPQSGKPTDQSNFAHVPPLHLFSLQKNIVFLIIQTYIVIVDICLQIVTKFSGFLIHYLVMTYISVVPLHLLVAHLAYS